MDPTFAIVQTDDTDLDVAGVARRIAEPLDMAVADLVQVLPQRSGILAENLPETIANRCAGLLSETAIELRVVPDPRQR